MGARGLTRVFQYPGLFLLDLLGYTSVFPVYFVY